jgi:hypothetical protein
MREQAEHFGEADVIICRSQSLPEFAGLCHRCIPFDEMVVHEPPNQLNARSNLFTSTWVFPAIS